LPFSGRGAEKANEAVFVFRHVVTEYVSSTTHGRQMHSMNTPDVIAKYLGTYINV
jgi:hypothetical protein